MFRDRESFTFQMLVRILGGFVTAAVGVFLFADIQVKGIVDQSQNTVYDEKLATIIRTLEASVKNLNSTGLVESYREDFQDSVIWTLRSTYYAERGQRVYPAILTSQGTIIMHPTLPFGDQSLQKTPYVQKMMQEQNGDVNYIYTNNEEKWCRFKSFEEWNWIVVYVVPLEIKYHDLKLLRGRLSQTLVAVMVIVLSVLSIMISRAIKPVHELTKVSEAMAAGDLSLDVNIDREDELGVLAKSFVSMRDSIKEKMMTLDSRNEALSEEISQREQVERDLAASERRLDTIIKTVPDIIYLLDDAGNILFINDAVRQYGYEPETLLGTSVFDLVYEKDRDIVKNKINERRTKERRSNAFEVRLLTKDQRHTFFELFSVSALGLYSSVTPERKTYLGTQGIARDITERKQAEVERENLIVDLRSALERVKTLSGLLPICANCKNIRDDAGYWNQIEDYLLVYSEVKFSHGLCPDCSDDLYGKEEWYINAKKKGSEKNNKTP